MMTQQALDSLRHAVTQAADSSLRAQVFSRLDLLGQKLGVAAEYLWRVLVRQAYAEAGMNIANFVIAGLVAWFVWSHFFKAWERMRGSKSLGDDFVDGGPVIAWGVGAVAVTIWFVVGIGDGVTAVGYLMNPEYFALQQAAKFVFGAGQ